MTVKSTLFFNICMGFGMFSFGFPETGSHYITQSGLELAILLSQPECFDYRHVLLSLTGLRHAGCLPASMGPSPAWVDSPSQFPGCKMLKSVLLHSPVHCSTPSFPHCRQKRSKPCRYPQPTCAYRVPGDQEMCHLHV